MDIKKLEKLRNKFSVYQKHRIILKDLPKEKFKKVLDAGCGDGSFTEIATKLGAKVYATDIDKIRLKKTEESLKKHNLKVIYKVADIRKLPFKDNNFDVVFCLAVLTHLPNKRDKALRELVRVTKPGGVIYLSTINILRMYVSNILKGKLPKHDMKRNSYYSKYVCGYSKKDVLNELNKLNVIVDSIKTYHPFSLLLGYNGRLKKITNVLEDFFAKYIRFYSLCYLFKIRKK